MLHIIHFYILDSKGDAFKLKKSNLAAVLLFITFIFSFQIASIIKLDGSFSELENKILKQRPKYSWESLKTGKFTSGYESYISDQFPLRSEWLKVKNSADIIRGKKDIRDIYIGKDGYLIEKYNKPNQDTINKNISSINALSLKNLDLPFYVMLVPNACEILKDKLPPFAVSYDQLKVLEATKASFNKNIKFVDVYETLKNKKQEDIYYKTDHHWTTKGAYYAYETFCNNAGIKYEDFTFNKVTEDFYGTLYSKVVYPGIKPDYLSIAKPKTDLAHSVEYLDTNKKTKNLYETEYLKKKDKYAVFLDGNHAVVKVSTNSNNNNKKLLVLKDSYANCFIPFIANNYLQIHIIDARYVNTSIQAYIKQAKIDEVLLLYNLNFFSNDDSIVKLGH